MCKRKFPFVSDIPTSHLSVISPDTPIQVVCSSFMYFSLPSHPPILHLMIYICFMCNARTHTHTHTRRGGLHRQSGIRSEYSRSRVLSARPYGTTIIVRVLDGWWFGIEALYSTLEFLNELSLKSLSLFFFLYKFYFLNVTETTLFYFISILDFDSFLTAAPDLGVIIRNSQRGKMGYFRNEVKSIFLKLFNILNVLILILHVLIIFLNPININISNFQRKSYDSSKLSTVVLRS